MLSRCPEDLERGGDFLPLLVLWETPAVSSTNSPVLLGCWERPHKDLGECAARTSWNTPQGPLPRWEDEARSPQWPGWWPGLAKTPMDQVWPPRPSGPAAPWGPHSLPAAGLVSSVFRRWKKADPDLFKGLIMLLNHILKMYWFKVG